MSFSRFFSFFYRPDYFNTLLSLPDSILRTHKSYKSLFNGLNSQDPRRKPLFLYLSVINEFEPLRVEEPVLEGGHGQQADDLDGEDEEAEDGERAENVDHLAVGP